MVENKNQFYLLDRWYYLLEETENKLIYLSKQDDKTDGNRIEIYKENNKINIIFISNKITLGKLEINCNNSHQIRFHYSQYESESMRINNETYGNLIYDLYASRNSTRPTDKIEIRFTKKRKLNKKLNKICYIEPKFPINQRINLENIDFNTKEIEFFKEIVNISPILIQRILKLIEEKDIKNQEETSDKIKELNIPETLYVYDRIYNFVRQEDNRIIYINEQCGITNLEIRIEPSAMIVTNVKLVLKEANDNQPPKHIIQMKKTETGLSARYHNCKKTNVYVNHEKLKESRIKSEVTFDSNNKNVGTTLEIETKYDKYKLIASPVKSTEYQDAETNVYEVYSNSHNDFQSMIPYLPGIYNHVQNSIFKEKELIKK